MTATLRDVIAETLNEELGYEPGALGFEEVADAIIAAIAEAGLAPAGGTLTAEELEAVSLGALALESLFSGEGSSPWLRIRNTRVKAIVDDLLKAIVERG